MIACEELTKVIARRLAQQSGIGSQANAVGDYYRALAEEIVNDIAPAINEYRRSGSGVVKTATDSALSIALDAAMAVVCEGTSKTGDGKPPFGPPWFIIDSSRAEPEVNWPGELLEQYDGEPGTVHPRVRHWKVQAMRSALSALAEPAAGEATGRHPLEAYADSYAQMARSGDGHVSCRAVEVDIRQNMMPVTRNTLSTGQGDRTGEAIALPDGVELKPFKPCVTINEEIGRTEATFEDAAYVAVPVFDGIHHWIDKHLALDDGRLVGMAIWETTPRSSGQGGRAEAPDRAALIERLGNVADQFADWGYSDTAIREAITALRAPAELLSAEDQLLAEIKAELIRARTKFPGKNVTFAALVEEVGELATATFEESRDAVRTEAVQVAVMAMRMVLDGDCTFDSWRETKGLDPLLSPSNGGK